MEEIASTAIARIASRWIIKKTSIRSFLIALHMRRKQANLKTLTEMFSRAEAHLKLD